MLGVLFLCLGAAADDAHVNVLSWLKAGTADAETERGTSFIMFYMYTCDSMRELKEKKDGLCLFVCLSVCLSLSLCVCVFLITNVPITSAFVSSRAGPLPEGAGVVAGTGPWPNPPTEAEQLHVLMAGANGECASITNHSHYPCAEIRSIKSTYPIKEGTGRKRREEKRKENKR